MKARVILIIALVLVLWASPAFAQGADNLPNTIEGLIVSLYAGSVRIVGLAAFLMLLYAGVLRLIGNGSESNKVIVDAVVGTVLLLSAVVILQSINPDLTQQGQIFREGEPGPGAGAGGGALILPTSGSILPIVVQ